MAGYATAMRIERIEIRGGLTARPVRDDHPEPATAVAVVELAGTDLGEPIRRRLEDVRIYLGQLTWYLFNAEGWR
jgi:hypothetical protein